MVEETIRFIKQSYHLEDLRVLDYERLRNLVALTVTATRWPTASASVLLGWVAESRPNWIPGPMIRALDNGSSTDEPEKTGECPVACPIDRTECDGLGLNPRKPGVPIQERLPMETNSVSRNDPCPCGSGKKHKKCCLQKTQESRTVTFKEMEKAKSQANDELLDYSEEKTAWLNIAPIEIQLPDVPIDVREYISIDLLGTWLLYLRSISDASDPETYPSDTTLAALFLHERGDTLDHFTRRFIEAARQEPFRFWQVSNLIPESGIWVKDMYSGEERFVTVPGEISDIHRWDIIFGQAVGLDDVNIWNGIGPAPLPPSLFRGRVERFGEVIANTVGDPANRITLLRCQVDLMQLYFQCLNDLFHPPEMKVRNTDGQALINATSRYGFSETDREDILESLEGMRGIDKLEADGRTDRFLWYGSSKSSKMTGIVMKGKILVGLDWLESECNSETRDKTLRKRLFKTFGDRLVHQSMELRPFDSDNPSAFVPPETASDIQKVLEDAPERVRSYIDELHMSWLDESIPALGGKTPREMCLTEEGKQAVAEMINDFENTYSRVPHKHNLFDHNKLRAALQIELA